MIATANTATLSWFAAHEIRLAWRDWKMLMSGGRKLKDRAVLVGMALFVLGVHGIVIHRCSAGVRRPSYGRSLRIQIQDHHLQKSSLAVLV